MPACPRFLATCLLMLWSCIALSAPTVEHRVPSYGEHAQQRVDLYVPAKTAIPLTLVVVNGCVSCHVFRGVGAKAHHLTAVAAEPHDGYALPLVSYAPDVWKNFIFDQRAVAELIGVSPNVLPDALGKQLYRLVENERP